ncbi:MAG: CDP-diacylglycerol--glycerol-3-phosphate 3-phosphatidyltransferase [Candidatus Omnitrophota bacterium]
MNLPNKLTILRIVFTFIYMVFLFMQGVIWKYVALFIFLAAMLTDWYDGKIARERNQITNFGKLMDPIADKILILASFMAFVELKIIPAWMVVVIILRELVITGLRVFAASKSVVLEAQKEGKHKTVSQFVVVISILIYLILKGHFLKSGYQTLTFETISHAILYGMMTVTIILTLYSGISYLWKNRRVIT